MGSKVKIGIIGGSALDDPDILENRQEKFVETQFGKPSDALIEGQISGVDCVLLARHGRKHCIAPSNVNYRANIKALKDAGCTHVVVSTLCGSLREDIHPGDLVIIDQFIDRTNKRAPSFFDGTANALSSQVHHMEMADPFCNETRKVLIKTAEELKFRYHKSGTAVTIEGPRFSTRAESAMFRQWGCDVVNMTTVPEAPLAKELGMCYAAVALPSDYDCWKTDCAPVSTVEVLKFIKELGERGSTFLKSVVPKIAAQDWTAVLAENEAKVRNSCFN